MLGDFTPKPPFLKRLQVWLTLLPHPPKMAVPPDPVTKPKALSLGAVSGRDLQHGRTHPREHIWEIQPHTENQGHLWRGRKGTRNGGDGTKFIRKVLLLYQEIKTLQDLSVIKINKKPKCLSYELPVWLQLTFPVHLRLLSSTQSPEHTLFLLVYHFSLLHTHNAFLLPHPSSSKPAPVHLSRR